MASEETNHIMQWISIAVGSGTLGVIIKSLLSRKKDKLDMTAQTIKSMLDIEARSKEMYEDLSEEFKIVKETLERAETKMMTYKEYIIQLRSVLIKNGIEVPEMRPLDF